MKKYIKILTIMIIGFISTPAFAKETVDCGVISEFTRPAAHWILFLAPMLLVVLGAIDFLGAVASNDEKDMKKAINTFMKRLIICIIIILLPTIINMIISFTTFNDLTSCI